VRGPSPRLFDDARWLSALWGRPPETRERGVSNANPRSTSRVFPAKTKHISVQTPAAVPWGSLAVFDFRDVLYATSDEQGVRSMQKTMRGRVGVS
jgi:hypothetical protein